MALSIKHNFVSTKSDGTDSSLLKPSDWNDDHGIELAAGNLVGRLSAGTGGAEEIPLSAAAAEILAASTVAEMLELLGVSAPTTGDIRLTLKTTATTGWVLFDDGTLGDASSGGTTRANADTQDLFNLLYANPFTDTTVPIFTSAGVATTRSAQGTAAQAFAAHCRMALPKTLGRALAIAGGGAGLTSRALGSTIGAETATIAQNTLPNATLTYSGSASVVSSEFLAKGGAVSTALNGTGGAYNVVSGPTSVGQAVSTGTSSGSTSSINGGVAQQPLSIMDPTVYLNAMVKL